MRRLLVIMTLLFSAPVTMAARGTCPSGVPSGVTTCFFVAASGADTNAGTSEASPWLHAPGMTNCASTCASTTPAAGEGFIFRGGDTWHFGNSAASPYVGAYSSLAFWTWQWGGTSGSPIYIGVDKTWFTGGSWTRPIMTGDNSLSTSVVASCTYDEGGQNFLTLDGTTVNYVMVDNFEWTGKCWSTSGYSNYAGSTIYVYMSLNCTIENSYFHGWTLTPGAYDDNAMIRGNDSAQLATGTEIAFNVFDGSDSSRGTTAPACQFAVNGAPCTSGMALEPDAWNVHHNVFRYLSNGWISNNTHDVHDNLFEYFYNGVTGCWSSTGKNCASGPNDGPHPNIFNTDGNAAGTNVYFYNNLVKHDFQNVGLWFNVSQALYFFNNVLYDMASVGPQNCVLLQSNTSSASAAFFYNNTIDGTGGCGINFNVPNGPAPAWNGAATFENNHFPAYASLTAVHTCQTSLTCTIADNGNEIYQTEAAANAQGYTQSNNYAPTPGGATIGAGANASGSCRTFSTDLALCSGTVGVTYDAVKHVAIPNAAVGRSSTAAWNAGAYQFANLGVPPTPASALTTVPH